MLAFARPYTRTLPLEPFVRIALRAARKSRWQLLNTYDRPPASRMGQHALQTFVNGTRNRLLRSLQTAIHDAYPEHAVRTSVDDVDQNSEVSWVIQPLDGISNFLRSLDDFCASVAIYEHDELQHSIVYHYLQDDEYFATRELEAMFNRNRLRVSSIGSLGQSVIAVSGSSSMSRTPKSDFHELNALLSSAAQGIRVSGSAGMDVARVAQGKLDAFVSIGTPPLAAQLASLLVTESGGFARCLELDQSEDYTPIYVAANPRIHSELQNLFGQTAT